jgi:hypothetical protein
MTPLLHKKTCLFHELSSSVWRAHAPQTESTCDCWRLNLRRPSDMPKAVHCVPLLKIFLHLRCDAPTWISRLVPTWISKLGHTRLGSCDCYLRFAADPIFAGDVVAPSCVGKPCKVAMSIAP